MWSIECTEHLYDKARFFQRAAQWLRPGGRMAICAWLAGDELAAEEQRQVYDVCEGFFCPSLGTGSDYRRWMSAAGLAVRHDYDWTARWNEPGRSAARGFAARAFAGWQG